MAYRILLRRDTLQNWSTNNPVLLSGEPGFETNTGNLKIGDGVTPWNGLQYYQGATGSTGPSGPSQDLTAVNGHIIPAIGDTYDLGATGGYSWRDLYLSGNTMYLGNAKISAVGSSVSVDSLIIGGPTADGGVVVSADNGYLTSNGSYIMGPTGATGPGGTGFSSTGGIDFPLLEGNQRTGSGNNLQFNKGVNVNQKIISTQDGTEDSPTVERLVVSGGDSYFNGTNHVGEGGDIYLWAGRGEDGGDVKVDAGQGESGSGGSVKVRGGNSDSGFGGFVEISSGYGPNGGGNISINTPPGGEIILGSAGQSWTLKNDGTITFPNGTIQPTAFTGIINITYSELRNAISNEILVEGACYKITDFRTCYDVPQYNVVGSNRINYRECDINPLVVTATSANTISSTAYQPAYPNDRIQYDWTWSETEFSDSPAYGRITERIDEYNNRTDYDHRDVTFIRFMSYNKAQQLTGSLSSYNSEIGEVTGTGTSFTTQVSPDDVLLFDYAGVNGFKVISIDSDTQLTVATDPDFGAGINFNNSGIDLYKSNASGFYDSTKEIYVGQYISGDFGYYKTFNLNVWALDNYIGDHSRFYLNEGENSGFLLSNNVFMDTSAGLASIVLLFSNNIGEKCYNNTVNHNFYNNQIGNSFSRNITYSYFYENSICDYFSDNIIGDYENPDSFEFVGNKIGSHFTQNKVKQSFYNNRILGNYTEGNIFSGVSTSNILGNSFSDNTIGDSFNGNSIGDLFYSNHIDDGFQYNEIQSNFHDNIIGNGFGYGNSVNQGNKIGNNFNNNTVYEYFYNNIIPDNFESNVIGNLFQWNVINTNVSSTNFTINYGNIIGSTYMPTGGGATDGTYTLYPALTTSQHGIGAQFTIEVVSGIVTSVTRSQSEGGNGRLYQIDDTLTITGEQIGGVTPTNDIVITVTEVSVNPSVYETYTCQIFERQGGAKRLSFYDENDILTIKNINE